MTTRVNSTTAHTKPPQSQMAAGEIKEYTYDASNDLGENQTITNPTVTLTNYQSGAAVVGGAQLDSPSVDDNLIYIRVANIAKGVAYLLKIEFDHEPPRVTGEHTVRFHIIDGV